MLLLFLQLLVNVFSVDSQQADGVGRQSASLPGSQLRPGMLALTPWERLLLTPKLPPPHAFCSRQSFGSPGHE